VPVYFVMVMEPSSTSYSNFPSSSRFFSSSSIAGLGSEAVSSSCCCSAAISVLALDTGAYPLKSSIGRRTARIMNLCFFINCFWGQVECFANSAMTQNSGFLRKVEFCVIARWKFGEYWSISQMNRQRDRGLFSLQ